MKYELTEATLSEVCSLVTDGTHDTPKKVPLGFPLIKAKEIVSGQIDFSSCDQISETEHRKVIARSKPEFGDTLFTHIGASLGAAAYVNTTREFSIKNIALFKPNPAIIDSRYLYYLVVSPDFQSLAIGTKTGSAQPFLGLSQLRGHRIQYHRNLAVQQRIAGILSAYDEFIENNQLRIKILESMARALYREWFIHFRFPGHQNHPRVASPLGEIPKGWEVKTVKEILARRPAGTVYRDTDVKPEGDIPVIDQSTSELLGFHDNVPDHNATSALPMAIFGDHTCKMQLLIEPFSVGPNVVPFMASQELPTAYVFYAVNSLVHTQEYKRHWIPLTAKEVFVADRVTAQRFASLIQPMLVTQETHRKAIRNLRRTRDLLLPRLHSGQINVEGA